MLSAPLILISLVAPGSFDPKKLHCLFDDGRFKSTLNFSFNADHEVVGEIDNYLIKRGQEPRFISGDALFNLSYNGDTIIGNVGDPRAVIDTFSLSRRAKQRNGAWMYKRVDRSGSISSAIFNCHYDGNSK